MADDTIDLLKIKIEKAKRDLPLPTINAINSVDWKSSILTLREKHGYTFEQLGELETETELLLCGLLNPENYPRELERRMGIGRAAANELVNEMNDMVFKKIREELIKSTERKKIFANKTVSSPQSELEHYPPLVAERGGPSPDKGRVEGFGIKTDAAILNNAGIEIVESKKPLPTKVGTEVKEVHPLLSQKLSSSFQIPVVKTEHTLENITKTNIPTPPPKNKIPNVDPYREMPE